MQSREDSCAGHSVDDFIKYIEDNNENISKKVNEQFELSKDFIRAKLLREIRDYLSPIPVHYEWAHDGCPYDYSGIIIEDGLVDTDQTISEFLENEYTGSKEATYISGMGFHHRHYGEDLSYLTLEIAGDIMRSSIRMQLKEAFNCKLSDTIFSDIMDICHDDIYDNCIAYDFFSHEPAIEFVGIGDRKLSQLIKKDK